MKLTFLGTGNAAGIPSAFCNCNVCLEARTLKNSNVRSRSSILIDDDLLIDVSPDFYWQTLKNNIYLSHLKTVLITHTHSDHFQPIELYHLALSKTLDTTDIRLYLSSEANAFWNRVKTSMLRNSYMKRINNKISFQVITPFKALTLTNKKVIAIPSKHMVGSEEVALNYVIINDKHTILYGTDTKRYDQETLQWLRQFEFDLVILDGNDGPIIIPYSNHNSFTDIVYILDNIILSSKVKIFLTHISHESGLTHNQLSIAIKQFSEYPIEIAKDGMTLEI